MGELPCCAPLSKLQKLLTKHEKGFRCGAEKPLCCAEQQNACPYEPRQQLSTDLRTCRFVGDTAWVPALNSARLLLNVCGKT